MTEPLEIRPRFGVRKRRGGDLSSEIIRPTPQVPLRSWENCRFEDFRLIDNSTFIRLLWEHVNYHGQVPVMTTMVFGLSLGRKFQQILVEIHGELSRGEMSIWYNTLIDIHPVLENYLLVWREKFNLEFSHGEWLRLLMEFIYHRARLPQVSEVYRGRNLGMKLDAWKAEIKSDLKRGETELFDQLCGVHPMVKEELERWRSAQRGSKAPKLSGEDWRELLLDFCEENRRTPIRKEVFRGQNLGQKLTNWKTKIKGELTQGESQLFEDLSALHPMVKEELERWRSAQEAPKPPKSVKSPKQTEEAWRELLLDFCEEYQRTPRFKEGFRGQNLGQKLTNWKTKIKAELARGESQLLEELSALHPLVRKELERWRLTHHPPKLTEKEWRELLLDFCEEHRRVSTRIEVFRGQNLGQKLNHWKAKIKAEVAQGKSELLDQLCALHSTIREKLQIYIF